MLVSAIHQHESATGIRTSPPSWASFSYSKFPLAIYFTYDSVFLRATLFIFDHDACHRVLLRAKTCSCALMHAHTQEEGCHPLCPWRCWSWESEPLPPGRCAAPLLNLVPWLQKSENFSFLLLKFERGLSVWSHSKKVGMWWPSCSYLHTNFWVCLMQPQASPPGLILFYSLLSLTCSHHRASRAFSHKVSYCFHWNSSSQTQLKGLMVQGIFPTQGSNQHLLGFLHWPADSLPLNQLGSPELQLYKPELILMDQYRSWSK